MSRIGECDMKFPKNQQNNYTEKRKFQLLRPSHFGDYTGHMFKVWIYIFIFSKCTYISTQVYVKV